jgi:hypothetical protein
VKLVDAHHEDVNLLGRVVPVKLLAPKFGIHLKGQHKGNFNWRYRNLQCLSIKKLSPCSIKWQSYLW